MTNHVVPFAAAFDRLGREVLNVLEGMPVASRSWPLPIPQGASPLSLALEVIKESEFWVLVVVGGQNLSHEHAGEASLPRTLPALAHCYQDWLSRIHQVLDPLPETALDLVVVLPHRYRNVFGTGPITVADCLLYALECCMLLVGRMQLLQQLFADGERILQEIGQ